MNKNFESNIEFVEDSNSFEGAEVDKVENANDIESIEEGEEEEFEEEEIDTSDIKCIDED